MSFILLLTLTSLIVVQGQRRPNIIIMQPDDLPFLDEWTAPPNLPLDQDAEYKFPAVGLPNIDSLRTNGLQMMQAYTASPMCGTSRYSTITGKMPSRAATVREKSVTGSPDPSQVTIPTTKLQDSVDGTLKDCKEENLAVAFSNANPPYRTAMIGKWHLSPFSNANYNYENAAKTVKECGFDEVKGLYVENLANAPFNSFSDGTFSHNMEWLTYEAIKLINETSQNDENFFMYFNPTVPHSSNDVKKAVNEFNCTDVADPDFLYNDGAGGDPWIKGMSEDGGCRVYRETVITRSNGNDDDIGKIWLDDAVGALLNALDDANVLDDTIFLFQEDHGMDTKMSLYEGGIRIPQFVHYPAVISPQTKFEGLVSTVDIAATMMDYADINPPPYEMDGKSWRSAIESNDEEEEWKNHRCLFFEAEQDRAVRCGCLKFLNIYSDDSKTVRKGTAGGLVNAVGGNLFNLCSANGEYVTANTNNKERQIANNRDSGDLITALECHLRKTDSDADPDYSVCPDSVDPSPVTAPTPVAAPVCADSSFVGIQGQNERTCAWFDGRGRCTQRRVWTHCHATCNKCDECEDSILAFNFQGNEIRCSTHADDVLCQDLDIAATCPQTCGTCWGVF